MNKNNTEIAGERTQLEKNKRQFAKRFSWEDWGTLCGHDDFLTAVETGEFGAAEVIAHQILTASPTADDDHNHAALRIDALLNIRIPAAKAELDRASAMPNAAKAVKRAEIKIAAYEAEVVELQNQIAIE